MKIFGLLQACGLVESGVEATFTIVNDYNSNKSVTTLTAILELCKTNEDPFELFDICQTGVTAQVTMDSCYLYGRTLPCAEALACKSLNRVVA